jgi:acetyl-CoA acetyltransferase
MSYMLPFRSYSAANWIGMFAQCHFHQYGTTREQLGWIAVNARRNAALNERAVYRDPISIDDYLEARMISEPLGLYDCDVPCDGATAIIISRRERTPHLRQPPVLVEALGTAIRERWQWEQSEDLARFHARYAAEHLWSRTDLGPGDVQLAELYDGFSILCLGWLEEMGFCGLGEGGVFVDGGKRIARDGELPLNTDGGQLSGGRLHGYGFLHEACVQLRGEGGERQVPGEPQVAAVGVGGAHSGCTAMLLTRA